MEEDQQQEAIEQKQQKPADEEKQQEENCVGVTEAARKTDESSSTTSDDDDDDDDNETPAAAAAAAASAADSSSPPAPLVSDNEDESGDDTPSSNDDASTPSLEEEVAAEVLEATQAPESSTDDSSNEEQASPPTPAAVETVVDKTENDSSSAVEETTTNTMEQSKQEESSSNGEESNNTAETTTSTSDNNPTIATATEDESSSSESQVKNDDNTVATTTTSSSTSSTEEEPTKTSADNTGNTPSSEQEKGDPSPSSPSPSSAPSSRPATATTTTTTPAAVQVEDDDDITSKAAVALAAVAAAAVANHKSPAEAAAQARAVAQSFLTVDPDAPASTKVGARPPGSSAVGSAAAVAAMHGGAGYGGVNAPVVLQTVSLGDVKTHLRQRSLETGMLYITEKLCQGENDAFLQHLLLLERFSCVNEEDDDTDPTKSTTSTKDKDSTAATAATSEAGGDGGEGGANSGDANNKEEEDDNKVVVAALAADKVISILKRLEGAFESLLNLLPPSARKQQQQPKPKVAQDPELNFETAGLTLDVGSMDEDDDDDMEEEVDETIPVVVPDLLPPCTSPQGDATVAFFRDCTSTTVNSSDSTEKSASAGEGTRERPADAGSGTASNMGTGQASDSADAKNSAAAAAAPVSTGRSMFGSIFRRSGSGPATTTTSSSTATSTTSTSGGLLGSLRRKTAAMPGRGGGGAVSSSTRSDDATVTTAASSDMSAAAAALLDSEQHSPGEYSVKIEKEMLGLTVENVLERTVVRTVLAGGPAKKAGAKVGSLIVKVGNVETKNLTHFETIDELRQSQRPLHLVLKQISEDALRLAREEMGRLIRGSGFGTIMDNNNSGGGLGGNSSSSGHHHSSRSRTSSTDDDAAAGSSASGGEKAQQQAVRPLIGADLRIEAYSNMIRRRFAESGPPVRNKKEEALVKVGEKLVWILTLFVVGLEKEASRLFALANTAGNDPSTPNSTASSQQQHRHPHSLYHHSAKDYADAARSVAKVLLDYTRKKINPKPQNKTTGNNQPNALEVGGIRRRNKGPPPPPPMPGRGRGGRRRPIVPGPGSTGESSMAHEKPLLQIGDVLQRTRTFLADTTSPPAALLRGELISFLCDVLDIDTEMELSEEDAVSATAGLQAGSINDLGSAGSLLKLIVLNCPIMRSPGCEEASARDERANPDILEELRRRFGPREKFSAVDLHRLHAGNRFLAVVHRLAASRSTSARITACSLGPVIWGHLDFPHQLQLRGVITRALHDVEVIVRKATATVLHEIAELVFDSRCVPWLVLMSERAMTDPEPQLRSAAMTLTWHLAEHLPNSFLGDASQGSRYLRRLPDRNDPIFADVYLLQCKLLPVATRLAEDRSPSVRLAVAAQCDRLCDALGDHWSSVVIDVLLGLLSDSDERVRCEAVMCVPRLADIALLSTPPGETAVSEVSILEALVPASIRLQKDPSSSVRVSLAAAAGEILTLLVSLQVRCDEAHVSGGENQEQRNTDTEGASRRYKRQVDERLIPLVQALLNDQDPEVTSAALRAVTNASRKSAATAPTTRHHLQSIASEDDVASVASFHSHTSREARAPVFLPVLSEVQVLRLLPTLTELADSRQWRVRQSAVEIVPALLGCTQKLETRSEISKLCIRLMSDKVDAVRATAAECLCMGGSSLGSHGEDASTEWITTIVIPAIRKCAVHSMSKQRLLSLKMIQVILENGACPNKWKGNETDEDRMTDSPMRELAVIALSLTQDRIANVRLNVGRVLETVLYVFEDDELSFIKEVLLQQLVSERERPSGGDRDVLFFADKCVNRAKQLQEERQDESSTHVAV